MMPLALLGAAIGALGYYEAQFSPLQTHLFVRWASALHYSVSDGTSPRIRFPEHGPFDRRLGYTSLGEFTRGLEASGFEVSQQARMSPRMLQAIELGLSPPFGERNSTGLAICDCNGSEIFARRYPERVYSEFQEIPELIRASLVFIENRELLRPRAPGQNPAVEWERFAGAVAEQVRSWIDPDRAGPGASTLATQIEKYRHSPDGITSSPLEKLKQMLSASLRAYRQGPDTRAARQRLVLAYLNTVPLAARVGHGEVNGIGDGLWVWYGRELDEINELVRSPGAPIEQRALAYKQALSLIVAERRPSTYLVENPTSLDALTNRYLDLLSTARILPDELRDAAQEVVVEPGRYDLPKTSVSSGSYIDRKASTAIRTALSNTLGGMSLYSLDRLDLVAASTLDQDLQSGVSEVLRRISQPAGAEAAGLLEPGLVGTADPGGITYSFTLYERSKSANVIRAQTDNLDQPFDLNSGSKLDLGSTAKLRTFITYLEIIAELHARLTALPEIELRRPSIDLRDELSTWAQGYLRARTHDQRGLREMLEAALERTYSASPDESFFTHGGVIRFSNFDRRDDVRTVTLREALEKSINLPFVRAMRDIVQYTQLNMDGSSVALLRDRDDPRRAEYLSRFADREGTQFLRRFYRRHSGRTHAMRVRDLIRRTRPRERELAAIFASLGGTRSLADFRSFLEANLREERPAFAPEVARVKQLYESIVAADLSLSDRGYIAGIHPLELWLVRFLSEHPDASLRDAISASAVERQEIYRWLFRTPNKRAQDERILTLLELEAFVEIHQRWERLGYPFGALVPSYATALGSSADRPSSLAELIGILLQGGVRFPTHLLREVAFAEGTPYETRFRPRVTQGERVLPVEVADVALAALTGVVERGTARRLRGVFQAPDGSGLRVGAKTGTGDNRFETFDSAGRLVSARVVSRSGTLVFFLGDSHYGVLTAYVEGDAAAEYEFTSALPTQILSLLEPQLRASLIRLEAQPGSATRAGVEVGAVSPEASLACAEPLEEN